MFDVVVIELVLTYSYKFGAGGIARFINIMMVCER